jgi:hypothetical protein
MSRKLLNITQAAQAIGVAQTSTEVVKSKLDEMGIEPSGYTVSTNGKGEEFFRYFYDAEIIENVEARVAMLVKKKIEIEKQIGQLRKSHQKAFALDA